MGAFFLDTSALVKAYVREPGTAWVRSLTGSSGDRELYVSRITGVEAVAALTRRKNLGDLGEPDCRVAVSRLRNDFGTRLAVIEVTARVVERAMNLAEKHGLRGYDAVQLASAAMVAELREGLVLPGYSFVCADENLNRAARTEGLLVENPETRP